MKTTTLSSLLLAGALYAQSTYAVPKTSTPNPPLSPRADTPGSFSWVKKWAAVGDSYTAGIGSGNPLGSGVLKWGGDDYKCSRYDTSYPMIIYDELGVEDFQFAACSGDRTGNIYEQIKNLDGDLDLVIMTAGGNDLCLSSLITKCVFSPYNEESCQDVLDIAQHNLDTIMEDSFKQLLEALDDKMAEDSVVVFNGYAQFFNTETEDCSENEDWTLLNPTGSATALRLTIDRRELFNDLVIQLNDIIAGVVYDVRKANKYKYKLGFSNWDYWPSEAVRGQYCDPDSTGKYPDPEVPDLQFFKLDTRPFDWDDVDSAKRDTTSAERSVAEEIDEALVRSPGFRRTRNPRHLVHQRLSRDGPARPNCPGDDDQDVQDSGGGWIPDDIGKNFHPNELGHYTIASWALQTAMDLRAEVLGADNPSCEKVDEFVCNSADKDRRAYASEGRLNERFKDFCDDVQDKYPKGEKGWSWERTYDEGTPDETRFRMELADSTDVFDYDDCRKAMEHVVNGCDGDDPGNPMGWKFGGHWLKGEYTYYVTPQRMNRPWQENGENGGGPIQEPYGTCESREYGVPSYYKIYGAGWANWDYGQESLLAAINDCAAGGVEYWDFMYYDEPTDDGHEWRATFWTGAWANSDCFMNDKAQKAAGGTTDGCRRAE